ncbi:hypothetical protein [Gilvibacter sediminis]|uniref:hypothetical protein n=1 Tax=Gilvibacter sediminis TaxID=379071 RepID=UPI002350DA46|nr:hypothetical protein [Gilvibacter sediminis]MDC7997303.1 hypothetical protein [Gilvibacter sediminis]
MKTLNYKTNPYLLAALILGVLLHGATVFGTLERTYDALIHLFFANHYATDWFSHWNQSWYTGFTVYGYPPLVHQAIGLFSLVGGLKFGLYTVSLIGVLLFVSGVFRFARLVLQNSTAAGYAALLCVFSTSFVETLHLFGQLPSIIGMSLLMHSCPEVYKWVRFKQRKALLRSWILIAIMVCSHHVTPIFGMVFFLFPVIGMALVDSAEQQKRNTVHTLIVQLRKRFWPIVGFGFGALMLIVFCILPYWLNTKNNPITQMPIPHGSRDNFFEVGSSGLVFFLIPWGLFLLLWPYAFKTLYKRRLVFFCLSFGLLALLGTGGTTPIPRMILGDNAFNILTLDRFTLWGSLVMLPVAGLFAADFFEGDLRARLHNKWGRKSYRLLGALMIGGYIMAAIATLNLGKMRPSQPKTIDMLPIVNFLNQDEHYKWRYLTLGFGDQMAWLSAQTKALTVDGNYHSARKLPELTTTPVERLENSKFRGIEGLGSLQQFLANPNKYNLKYVFSNDKFYDPLLHFSGWKRLPALENGIVVWEREGVNTLPSVLNTPPISKFQMLIWGIVPVSVAVLGILIFIFIRSKDKVEDDLDSAATTINHKLLRKGYKLAQLAWVLSIIAVFAKLNWDYYQESRPFTDPEKLVLAYYDAMDFKEFERAHSYLDPDSGKTLDRFMLEIAITDGLLSSYGKLDDIRTEVLFESEDQKEIAVKTEWITALKNYKQQDTITAKKQDGRWVLVPKALDLDIPVDVYLSKENVEFYNQGRRRNTLKTTFYEDVLKRPEVAVTSAKLIEYDDQYFLVGQIKNIDYHPASLLISASLYDENGQVLAQFAPKDAINYRVMPEQQVPFRIPFEEIAWVEDTSQIDETFSPDFAPALTLSSQPVSFEIAVTTNVTSDISPQNYSIEKQFIADRTLELEMLNANTSDCTIPQFLVEIYNKKKELVWVEPHYGDQALRPYRRGKYLIDIAEFESHPTPKESGVVILINGKPKPILENRGPERLMPLPAEAFYVDITLNPYHAQN